MYWTSAQELEYGLSTYDALKCFFETSRLGQNADCLLKQMADTYPSAEVLGLDIAAVQPEWVPPNCQFQIDDVEMPWALEHNNYDLIHARDLLLSIRDWPRLVDQAFEYANSLKKMGHLTNAKFPVIFDLAATLNCNVSTPNSSATTALHHQETVSRHLQTTHEMHPKVWAPH